MRTSPPPGLQAPPPRQYEGNSQLNSGMPMGPPPTEFYPGNSGMPMGPPPTQFYPGNSRMPMGPPPTQFYPGNSRMPMGPPPPPPSSWGPFTSSYTRRPHNFISTSL